MNDSAPKTMQVIEDDSPKHWDMQRDEAWKDGFSLLRLERIMADLNDQPMWRERADLAAAFVDGKQFTPEQEAMLAAEGLIDLRPTNLVSRTIRSVCGQEAKARTDIKVESDDERIGDVCDVLNADMKEAQRETYADMAVSQAYFGQTSTGIGVVEVGENEDPLDYPDRVEEVHRSEFWWDWKSTNLLNRDGRYQVRKRWVDLDELEAAKPKFRTILRNVANNWAGFIFDDTNDEVQVRAWNNENRWNMYQRRTEWYDSGRKRVKLYEVWYKVPAMAVVMHLSPTHRILFDERNQFHIHAVANNLVKVTKARTRQIRMALFAGPHRLEDVGTSRRNFPYVPFFAYRDDEDMSPYGLVEGMISPQMEYNARRARINWMLRARQIQMDSDALDTEINTLEDVAAAVMRPDLTIITNPNRINKNQVAIKIGSDIQLQKEQIDVMQDAKQLLQDVPGIYGSQLGQAPTGVTSGIANSLLIEQGNVSMGDLNDNYRHARRAVFELLLENCIRRRNDAQMKVMVGRGSGARIVVLNTFDEEGNIINNVADAPVRVGLGEVPSTPAFRMQQQNQIATVINALAQMAPQAAAVMAPSFIEATDLPDRVERADDVRRLMGLPTAQDKQKAAKMEKAGQEQAAKAAAIAEAGQQLSLEKLAADVVETKSRAELNKAKVMEMGHGLAMQHVEMAANQAPSPEDEQQRLIEESINEASAAVAA